LYQLYNSWGCLSRDQKDEVVGGFIGGIAGGAVAGAIAPTTANTTIATAESAQNAMNGVRLSEQLTLESANSAFTTAGELSEGAIANARQIIRPGALRNPAIPSGFGKYTTQTFSSPSGPFQVHFYMNLTTEEI